MTDWGDGPLYPRKIVVRASQSGGKPGASLDIHYRCGEEKCISTGTVSLELLQEILDSTRDLSGDAWEFEAPFENGEGRIPFLVDRDTQIEPLQAIEGFEE